MPEAEDVDCPSCDLMAQLKVADGEPSDLARLIGFKLLAYPRKIEKSIGYMGKLLDDTRRRFRRNKV